MHIPLTEISIFHFDSSVFMVFSWLFPFSFLKELLLLLIFWNDLLMFRSCNMGSFSTPQNGNIFHQYLILKLLEILYSFPFILLLYKPPLLSFRSYLGLYCLFYLLSVMVHLNTNNFLFLLSIFLDLIFLFFWFSFLFTCNNEKACDCSHMTYHMMWSYKPRLG